MNTALRTLSSLAALSSLALASADVALSFGDAAGNPITTLDAPALSATATISVLYTSTTALSDSEIFVGFDRAVSAGSSAMPLDGLVSLAAPSAPSGVALNMVQTNGGVGASGPQRPYGLDILSVSATSGNLPATSTPKKLFDVTLTDLGLAPGGTATLSFNLASGPLYTTNLFDAGANPVAVTGGGLRITAAPVPEPAPLAALAVGALGLLRHRRR